MGESLTPHLPRITTLMLLSLRSTEGIMVSTQGGLGQLGTARAGMRSLSWAQLSQSPCCASPFQPQYNGSSTFLLFDDERGGEEEEELTEEDEEEEDDSEISGCGGCHSGLGDPGLDKGPGPALLLLTPDCCCLPTLL